MSSLRRLKGGGGERKGRGNLINGLVKSLTRYSGALEASEERKKSRSQGLLGIPRATGGEREGETDYSKIFFSHFISTLAHWPLHAGDPFTVRFGKRWKRRCNNSAVASRTVGGGTIVR